MVFTIMPQQVDVVELLMVQEVAVAVAVELGIHLEQELNQIRMEPVHHLREPEEVVQVEKEMKVSMEEEEDLVQQVMTEIQVSMVLQV